MKSRAAATITYGAILGAWAYANQTQIDLYSQRAHDVLQGTVFGIAFGIALPILVALLVGRWWVLAALIGPLCVLGYLQLTGYVSPWHDGASPLGFPSLFLLCWLAFLLLLGVAFRWLLAQPTPPPQS